METNYQEIAKKNQKKIGIALLFIALLAISYRVGFAAGKKGLVFEPKTFKVISQQEQPKVVDYNLLWDAINILDTKYIDKPVNPQKVLYGAIRGAVASTGDPYTDFFEPKALQSFKTDLKGSFDGIGAEISKKDGLIVIVAPLDESPAQKAGLKAQDIIVKVDGQSTENWSVEETVGKIRGQKGTPVNLTIYRKGKDKPFDVKIIRDVIKVKSVKWEFKTVEKDGKKKNIAVITLSKFGDDTEGLFNQAVTEALNHNAEGLVLDLRNDPGGYLQTAVAVASNWLKSGTTVVTEAKSTGENTVYKAEGASRFANMPTVVLINGGSASAAEILSGALHDYKIAKLVGEKSFGKGSVQELVDLRDGSAVKVTIAKWITPNGKNLNKDGLDPDVKVSITEEDAKNNKDAQMEKALEEIVK
jgi:carboxyl-terminal processing protease